MTAGHQRRRPPGRAKQRLLILSCSKSKKDAPGKQEALALYDGPAFRVLRRFMSKMEAPYRLDVLILSARYGFILGSTKITSYDARITSHSRPNPQTLQSQLRRHTRGKRYSEVFV